MTDGGTEFKRRASPFYERVRPIFIDFAEQNGAGMIEWYDGKPHFVIGIIDDEITRTIQIYIEPKEPIAVISIFGLAFVKRFTEDERSVFAGRDFFIAIGYLPRDEIRIRSWCDVAWAILNAVEYDDLFDEQTMRKRRPMDPLLGPGA